MARWMTGIAMGLALLVSTAAGAGETRRALVIGANDGGTTLEPLRYAEQDAWRVAEVLRELGGFRADEVTVLLAPSVDELQSALKEAGSGWADDSDGLFLFYYSGHADARGLRLQDDVVPYEDLKSSIREIPTSVQLGIVDACRSGAITRLKGAVVSEPFLSLDMVNAEGEAWIAASAADEDAQESDRLQGSFFTHYLLSGLRGAADGGDGFVSLSEAYGYAYERTVARTSGTTAGTQHPSYDFQMQGRGDLRLTDVSRASARLDFPEEHEGVITVHRLPENTPVAEVVKQSGQPTSLAVSPGRYLLRSRVDGELSQVRVFVDEGAVLRVTRWGAVQMESGTAKGAEIGRPGLVWLSSVRSLEEALLDPFRNLNLNIRLRRQPLIAGAASGAIPGLGQAYGGRWGTGALFFVGTVGLGASGGLMAVTGSEVGAHRLINPALLGSLALWGWSIADATYGIHRREDFRPRQGWVLSGGVGWLPRSRYTVHSSGVALDWIFANNLSIGIDRVGWTQRSPSVGELNLGARLMAGLEHSRVRPAVFVAVGTRMTLEGDAERNEISAHQDLVVATGVNLRLYVTPRYFLETEARTEWIDRKMSLVHALGFGVHFGS